MKIFLQATASGLLGMAFFGLVLFWPAGTFDYWQAWVFIGVFAAATAIPTAYLAVKSPATLQRRMRVGPGAETRTVQKVVTAAFFLIVMAVFVVSAFDHRFDWSQVPTTVAVVGEVLVAAGLFVAQYAVIQNAYAASNITVEDGQAVISHGLYGVVRHPLYFGALIMMIGAPVALGSYWGFVALVPFPLVLAFRILDEERMLADELAGYGEYTQKVRYRLVPSVW